MTTFAPNYSRELKTVLAVVILFLGWLIASMVPKSEAPWDKTGSSYLAQRPSAVGSESNDPDYSELWNPDNKENLDSKTKEVKIPEDFGFFDQTSSNPVDETASAEPPQEVDTEEDAAQSSPEEIRIASDDLPDVQPGNLPNWEDNTFNSKDPLEINAGSADLLAPPMDTLSSSWDEESAPSEQETADSSEEVAETSGSAEQETPEDSSVSETETAANQPNESDQVSSASASPLPENEPNAVAATPLPENEAASDPQPDEPAETTVSQKPEEAPETEPAAQPDTSSQFYALPTQRPKEQDYERPQSVSQPTSAPLLPFKSLSPSNGRETLAANEPAAPNPISQASASISQSQSETQASAAYYEEPTPVPRSRPSSISVYTAGSGETWGTIAAKFGLSQQESAQYAEINSFRINSDSTVTEGMKLMLPKR